MRTEIPSEEILITIISPPSVNTEMRQHSLKSSTDINFNEDDQQKMPVEVLIDLLLTWMKECADLIVDAIDKRQKEVILTLGGKIGVMMKPFFPWAVEYFAKRKAGGVVSSKL